MENNSPKMCESNVSCQVSNVAAKSRKGFTLLELLIVITILAVLSVAIIVVINPAETIKKARDTQRISDLSSIKTAISLYASLVSSPFYGASGDDTVCKSSNAYTTTSDNIFYSVASDVSGTTTDITDMAVDNTTFTSTGGPKQGTLATVGLTNGTGWIPINLSTITTGSPISNFPVDPTNDIAATGTGGGTASSISNVNRNALVYRYVCDTTVTGGNTVKSYEIDATLESEAFTTATNAENKTAKDGGNDSGMYEIGTNLLLLSGGGANVTDTTILGF